jgi:hypothetical protein
MTVNDPMTPPPELVEQWYLDGPENDELGLVEYVATQAACWGADQELLACGKYLERCATWEEEDVTEMYNYRRPRPLSLKEQALQALNRFMATDGHEGCTAEDIEDDYYLIRKAVESLSN